MNKNVMGVVSTCIRSTNRNFKLGEESASSISLISLSFDLNVYCPESIRNSAVIITSMHTSFEREAVGDKEDNIDTASLHP